MAYSSGESVPSSAGSNRYAHVNASLSVIPPAHDIADVPVHPVRLEEVLKVVERALRTREQISMMYANAYGILLAQNDAPFREALQHSDLVFCDGNGVRLAGRILGKPLPERFTPPDWIDRLAELCARGEYRLFLLGAEPGVAARAAARLRERFPALDILTHHGYFDPEGPENEKILNVINEAAPDVLLLGMGMPRQEIWTRENQKKHTVPVVISVGALFDYLAGNATRGPRWMTDNGLEWLCRLWYEPRRLWRRYLLGNPAFMGLILREWLRQRQTVRAVRKQLARWR